MHGGERVVLWLAGGVQPDPDAADLWRYYPAKFGCWKNDLLDATGPVAGETGQIGPPQRKPPVTAIYFD
jgi:hypothetical protein